jgi:pimeloyl-ACP methyl ester carboxylesterase
VRQLRIANPWFGLMVGAVEPRILEHDQTGDGATPLVLLPGGLTGWLSWLPLVPALSEDRSVVRLQPIINAEGSAGRISDGIYDVEVDRESIDQTLEEIGAEEMHLVGWSNGGRMAIDFALAHPERIKTLTLIEPAAWWLVEDIDSSAKNFAVFVADCAEREVGEEDLERFLIDVGVAPAHTDFRSLEPWELWSSCRQSLSWYGERTVRSAAEGIEGFERIEAPTLLIRGRATAPWLRSVVETIAGELPSATVIDLPGGHAGKVEHAREFISALTAHLQHVSDSV